MKKIIGLMFIFASVMVASHRHAGAVVVPPIGEDTQAVGGGTAGNNMPFIGYVQDPQVGRQMTPLILQGAAGDKIVATKATGPSSLTSQSTQTKNLINPMGQQLPSGDFGAATMASVQAVQGD